MGRNDSQGLSAALIEVPEPGRESGDAIPGLSPLIDLFLYLRGNVADVAMTEHPGTTGKSVGEVAHAPPAAGDCETLQLQRLLLRPDGEAGAQQREAIVEIGHGSSART